MLLVKCSRIKTNVYWIYLMIPRLHWDAICLSFSPVTTSFPIVEIRKLRTRLDSRDNSPRRTNSKVDTPGFEADF